MGGKGFGIGEALNNSAGGEDAMLITVIFIEAPKFVCFLFFQVENARCLISQSRKRNSVYCKIDMA